MGKKIIGVYQIRNIINEKVYIGSSLNIDERFKKHKQTLRRNKHHNIHLQRAWNKYGESNFIFEVLIVLKKKNKLLKTEQNYIDNSDKKYNIAETATATYDYKHTKSTKKKISEFAKSRTGSKNPFYGKKVTEEMKRKARITLGDKLTGKNNPFYGKKHSKKTLKLLSKKLIGRKMPKSFLEKQSGNERGAKKYIIQYANGKECEIYNLKKFCALNELDYRAVIDHRYNKKSYKGMNFISILS